jgi:PAS domain S-box-containing protein
MDASSTTAADAARPVPPELAAALRLFDETTAALGSRIQRLEEVLLQKTRALAAQVEEADRLRARLDLVLESVASGVIAVDGDGRIITANAAAQAALGADAATGASYRAAFPDSPLPRLLAGSEVVGAYEHLRRAADGSRRVLAAKATPLRDAAGRLLGAVEVFEDVTEVRRLQEEVERADRLQQLGEMAAGVAHEIRNPLNGIEGFASLLARDLPAGTPGRRHAELIVGGVRDLNRTVSGLLEFTRARRLERRPHRPGDLAATVVELVRAELGGAATPALEVEDRWRGGSVACDAVQLKQVLLNLLQNAVQALQEHRPDAGVVRLTIATDDDGAAVFTVDDDGPGVPAEARQRIFTPFYTTKDHGTGLGLAVSYRIIDQHGGALAVADSPLGGARFTVTLPP